MSIKTQVDDAIFLYQNNRHLGALTNLMLAVAGSSSRVLPIGELSKNQPPSKNGKIPLMTDGERFELFLGGRLRKIAYNETSSDDIGTSGMTFPYKNNQFTIEKMLYKFHRCKLVHDGELPSDIEFVADFGNHRPNYILNGNHGSAAFACHSDKLMLNYSWIPLLVDVVAKAFCNRDLFGIIESELLPIIPGFDEELFKAHLRSVGNLPLPHTSSSFFSIFKTIAKELNPATINLSSDRELNALCIALVRSGRIIGGAVTGVVFDKLMDWDGSLTKMGIVVLREIAKNYELK